MAPITKLRRTADFRRVVRAGDRVSGKRVTMYFIPAADRSRVGFVARREVGGAVVRNRARRVLREAWRAVSPHVGRPVDVVFVARSGAAQAKAPEVAEEVRALMVRKGLISP
jgi:ribonuclease P protein component